MDNKKAVALVMGKKYLNIANVNETNTTTTKITKTIRSSNIDPNRQTLELNIKNVNGSGNLGETPDDLIDSIVNNREKKNIYESTESFTQTRN